MPPVNQSAELDRVFAMGAGYLAGFLAADHGGGAAVGIQSASGEHRQHQCLRPGQRKSVVASNAPVWPTSYRDLAPRIGAAFRLTKDGRTVLRAGAGLYYDSSLSIATDILDGGPLNSAQLTQRQSCAIFVRLRIWVRCRI